MAVKQRTKLDLKREINSINLKYKMLCRWFDLFAARKFSKPPCQYIESCICFLIDVLGFLFNHAC